MGEREVIVSFVNHLGKKKGCPNLSVMRWPEDYNRQSPEVDAMAGPFVIEHTSIDSVADQRRSNARFMRAVEGLDRVIADSVESGFFITLEYDAIAKGKDWKRIRADLKKWIVENAADLGYGLHKIPLPTLPDVDPPILMYVSKGQSGATGFRRTVPCDSTLSRRLRGLLDRKAMKLKRYRTPDTTTILLVENDDIALMNELKMLGAIKEAYPHGPPQGVDELWLADTSIPKKPKFRNITTVISEGRQRPSRLQ